MQICPIGVALHAYALLGIIISRYRGYNMDKLSVLIVEDNELNQDLFRELLVLDGCDVSVAVDAESGIDMARELKPDVILMDIQLPGMDGLAATKLIRNDDEFNGVPIIALTAHAMSGDEDKAYDAGCIGYITKPVNTRTFYKEIRILIDPLQPKP